jgi:hypothetical protein
MTVGRNPSSGVRYREQSLCVQVRIPFTQRAVQLRLETPYDHLTRMMRADGIRHPAARSPHPEPQAAPEAGFREPDAEPEPEPDPEAEL